MNSISFIGEMNVNSRISFLSNLGVFSQFWGMVRHVPFIYICWRNSFVCHSESASHLLCQGKNVTFVKTFMLSFCHSDVLHYLCAEI